jgi:hypothetical protein
MPPLQMLQDIAVHNKVNQDLTKGALELKEKQAADPTIQAENQVKKIQSGAQQLLNSSDEPTYQLRLASLGKQGFTADDLAQYPPHFTPDAVQSLKNTAIGPVEQAKLQATIPVEKLELQSFMANPPKGYKATPEDFAKWKALIAPAFRINMQNTAGGLIPGGGSAGGGTGPGAAPSGFTIANVPPQLRPQVQAALDYRAALPSAARANPQNQAIRYWTYQLDPTYDETTFPERNKVLQQTTKDAQTGSIGAINTALGHLGELNLAAQAVEKHDTPALNALANKLHLMAGNDDQSTYNLILHRVSPELTSAYVAGGGGEHERGANEGDFDLSKGAKQIQSNIAESANLLNSKLDSKRQAWNAAFRPYRDADQFDNRFLTPQARDTLGRLSSQAPTAQAAANNTMVTLKAPNGKTKQVPANQVKHYTDLGAVVVSQ